MFRRATITGDASLQSFSTARDAALTLRPDVPVYCFRPEVLTADARAFIAAFPGETAYAVKTNGEPMVLETSLVAFAPPREPEPNDPMRLSLRTGREPDEPPTLTELELLGAESASDAVASYLRSTLSLIHDKPELAEPPPPEPEPEPEPTPDAESEGTPPALVVEPPAVVHHIAVSLPAARTEATPLKAARGRLVAT